jgi:hypothetical protein
MGMPDIPATKVERSRLQGEDQRHGQGAQRAGFRVVVAQWLVGLVRRIAPSVARGTVAAIP